MKEDIRTILKQHHIYMTNGRLAMLEIFRESNDALTYNHFLSHPLLHVDRITIFRTLKLFADKKIIHRIPGTDGINHYLLEDAEENVHSNFMCGKCKRIIPLKTVVQPKVKLPKGFRQENMEIVVDGLCNLCRLSK